MININFFKIEYVVVAIAGILLYILYYLFSKDSSYLKSIHSIASVVEDQNREIFYIKQKIEDIQNDIKKVSLRMSDDDIYQEVERSVYDLTQPLSLKIQNIAHTLENIDAQIENIDAQVDSRVSSLESGVKQISIPTSLHSHDDEKIIDLYRQGISLEMIAKELRISQPEAEFVLKINKIK